MKIGNVGKENLNFLKVINLKICKENLNNILKFYFPLVLYTHTYTQALEEEEFKFIFDIMYFVIYSLKCFLTKKDSEVKLKREIGENTNAISIAAAVDGEEQSFFNCFIEGVVNKLYLPKHNNVIKYGHWKHLASCYLKIQFPGPYDLQYAKKNVKGERDRGRVVL